MVGKEVKYITDTIKEMMATQIARLDPNILDENRKWEANERRWAEMRTESRKLMEQPCERELN